MSQTTTAHDITIERPSVTQTILYPAAAPPPPALSESRVLRLVTFCALYFAQGVPTGFVSIALIAILSERGASSTQIAGLVSVAFLPWSLKLIWGPTIDSLRSRTFGERRPWIIFAQAMMALTLLVSIASWDLSSGATLGMLGLLFFVHNCFASLQDVATDGLAVDLLDDDERGRVNGFMWASKMCGVAVGGAGMATVAAKWGLEMGMRIQAAIILSIMLLPLLVVERPGDKRFPWSRNPGNAGTAPRLTRPRTNPLGVARQLLRAFGLRTTFIALFVAILAFVGEGLAIPTTVEVFTQRLGWTAEHFSHAQGIWGTIGKLIGAIIGGFLCDRLGCRCVAVFGIILASMAYLVFSMTSPWWQSEGYPFYAYLLLVDLGGCATGVALLSLFMKISWTMAAATQFTLYMTVCNIGGIIGPQFTRFGLDHSQAFAVCGLLTLMPLVVLPFVRERVVAARKLQEEIARA